MTKCPHGSTGCANLVYSRKRCVRRYSAHLVPPCPSYTPKNPSSSSGGFSSQDVDVDAVALRASMQYLRGEAIVQHRNHEDPSRHRIPPSAMLGATHLSSISSAADSCAAW
jgi:hypothetical protein